MKLPFKFFLRLFFILMLSFTYCKKNTTEIYPDSENCGETELSGFLLSDTTGEFALITGVRLIPLDKEYQGQITKYFYSSSLNNQIVFSVHTEYKMIDSTEIPYQIDTLNTGDPSPPETVNPIIFDRTKTALRFDKDIKYKETIIAANENILEYDTFGDNSIYFPYTIGPFAIHEIHLDKEYFEIEKGCYEVSAEWQTKYGEIINDTVKVFINVE